MIPNNKHKRYYFIKDENTSLTWFIGYRDYGPMRWISACYSNLNNMLSSMNDVAKLVKDFYNVEVKIQDDKHYNKISKFKAKNLSITFENEADEAEFMMKVMSNDLDF